MYGMNEFQRRSPTKNTFPKGRRTPREAKGNPLKQIILFIAMHYFISTITSTYCIHWRETKRNPPKTKTYAYSYPLIIFHPHNYFYVKYTFHIIVHGARSNPIFPEPEAKGGRPVVEVVVRGPRRCRRHAAGRRAQPKRTKKASGRGDLRLTYCSIFLEVKLRVMRGTIEI